MQRTWRQVGDRWWFSLPWSIGLELRRVGSRTVGSFVLFRDGREVSRHNLLPQAQGAVAELEAPATQPDDLRGWRPTRESVRNPGRTLPAIVDRCVAHVAPRLKDRGPRGALSGAVAICTAQAQKRGALKKGSRSLTARGKREERSATRRKGYKADTRAVKALAREAREAPPLDPRIVAIATVLRERQPANLADVAFAIKMKRADARKFVRAAATRAAVAKFMGAKKVTYTASKKSIGHDLLAVVSK
jgi:hypothetical protein